MKHSSIFATVVALLAVVGCSYGSDRRASPEVTSLAVPSRAAPASPSIVATEPVPVATASAHAVSPSASARPTPTARATPSEPPSPTADATPISPPAEPTGTPEGSPAHVGGLEASDRFWEFWYDTCFFGAPGVEPPSSLAEIAQASDLVIRGAIAGAYSRWRGGDAYDSYVQVSIAEILKGEPVYRGADTVDVGISYLSSDIESQELGGLPSHDHLWFLVGEEEREGRYYTTDYVQVSVLRDIGGVVEVIWPEAIAGAYSRDQFPVPLDGTSFEDLVQRVRDLAAEQAGTNAFAKLAPPGDVTGRRFLAC